MPFPASVGSYMNETCGNVSIHVKEHRKHTKLGWAAKSKLAVHLWDFGHWFSLFIYSSQNHTFKRKDTICLKYSSAIFQHSLHLQLLPYYLNIQKPPFLLCTSKSSETPGHNSGPQFIPVIKANIAHNLDLNVPVTFTSNSINVELSFSDRCKVLSHWNRLNLVGWFL